MTTLKITTKGQITLRKDLQKHLGVGPGQKIEVDKLPDGRIIVKAAAVKGTISDFMGCLYQKGSSIMTIDEINKMTAIGWAGEK